MLGSNLASNHRSLLRSFSWPALSLLSAVSRSLKRVDRSVYSTLDSTNQGTITFCIEIAGCTKDGPKRSLSNLSES